MPINNSESNSELNSTDNEKITLFIHKSSTPCQKLIELIKNHSKKFNIDLVDIAEINQIQIPKEITSLPALVIKNGYELIFGKNVFEYFQNLEMEYVDLNSNSKSFGYSFENFGDIDSTITQSSNIFSSINEKDMSYGVPEYNESSSQSEIDITKIQAERDKQLK